MPTDEVYIPFSQRTGLEPIPPQLKLGEASPELRRLIAYYIGLEINREARSGYDRSYFDGNWLRVAMDFHVLFLGQDYEDYRNSAYEFEASIKYGVKISFRQVV